MVITGFDSIIRTPVYYMMDRANRYARIEIPELMPLDNVVTEPTPTVEPESERSVREPEVKYVYTMKFSEPERQKAKVYSCIIPSESLNDLHRKPINPERLQVEVREPVHDHVCQNLSNYAGEFETVSGTGAGDDYVTMSGMTVEDEIHVGGVGIHAHGSFAEYRIDAEVFTNDTFYCGYFLGGYLPVEVVGVGRLAVMVVGNFQAIAQVGEAVKHGVFDLPNVDRKMVRLEGLQRSAGMVEPEDYLALDG